MELNIPLLFSVAFLVAAVAVFTATKSARSHSSRFPGPTQLPLIGRVHDLPLTSAWLKLKEWADIYGPIYQTSMMGQRFIVVSNEDMARDILIKKGNSFSGRLQIRALIDHKLGPTYVALQDRNETWRRQRKWVHAAMVAAHQEHFYGHIDKEIKRYLTTLLINPTEFHSSTRELFGRIMSTLAWDDATQGEKFGITANETLRQMSLPGPIVNAATPLWHIADFLGYNPWRNFERAREDKMTSWWSQLLLQSKKRFLEQSLPKTSWAYRYFEQVVQAGNSTLEQSSDEEHFAACMLGFQNMVGVVTVAGPMQYFLMCMALHPLWQMKIQEQIDIVCGDRMPTIDDYQQLPVLRACIKETLRWRSTVPLGVPHLCEEDSEYKGVAIKKGTVVLACEWALNRDESQYPDPEKYRPERWLEPAWPTFMEPLTRYPNLREGHGMHTFGWGRRMCLGQAIADEELFLLAANVCWAFNMSIPDDPLTGKPTVVDSQATNSNVILEPTPWPMTFKTRSQEKASKILNELAQVQHELKV